MRLIDADALMERIVSINNPDMLTIGKVVGTIDTQPTAYDIDKVVKELDEQINIAKSDYNLTKENVLLVTISELQRARAIVKQQLKEQTNG